MISLRVRKLLYLGIAAPACLLWLPTCAIGIAFFGIGLIGLASMGSLLMCIAKLPLPKEAPRIHFAAAILAGVVMMALFIAISIANTASYVAPIVAGALLCLVGIAVLIELYLDDLCNNPA